MSVSPANVSHDDKKASLEENLLLKVECSKQREQQLAKEFGRQNSAIDLHAKKIRELQLQVRNLQASLQVASMSAEQARHEAAAWKELFLSECQADEDGAALHVTEMVRRSQRSPSHIQNPLWQMALPPPSTLVHILVEVCQCWRKQACLQRGTVAPAQSQITQTSQELP